MLPSTFEIVGEKHNNYKGIYDNSFKRNIVVDAKVAIGISDAGMPSISAVNLLDNERLGKVRVIL